MSDLDKAIERLRSASFLEGGDPEFDGADPVEDVKLVLSEIASLRAQVGQLNALLQEGLYCEVENKSVPISIDGGFRDASVGLEEGPSLIVDGYELIPVSLMNDIREMHGWEKLLDLWQQTHGDLTLTDELQKVEK